MNERIRELALQANMTFNGTDLSGSIGRVQCYEDELEKFAELIVRECVSVVQRQYNGDLESGYYRGLFSATEIIKEHFGVEE
jgi:hypothetical protein